MESTGTSSRPAGPEFLVHVFVSGPVSTNIYVIEDGSGPDAIAIDPGGAVDKVVAFLRERPRQICSLIRVRTFRGG